VSDANGVGIGSVSRIWLWNDVHIQIAHLRVPCPVLDGLSFDTPFGRETE
jgi:hypothetical protein